MLLVFTENFNGETDLVIMTSPNDRTPGHSDLNIPLLPFWGEMNRATNLSDSKTPVGKK